MSKEFQQIIQKIARMRLVLISLLSTVWSNRKCLARDFLTNKGRDNATAVWIQMRLVMLQSNHHCCCCCFIHSCFKKRRKNLLAPIQSDVRPTNDLLNILLDIIFMFRFFHCERHFSPCVHVSFNCYSPHSPFDCSLHFTDVVVGLSSSAVST